MTTLADRPAGPRPAPVEQRLSFRFSALGRYAAGLRTDGLGPPRVEVWTFDHDRDRATVLASAATESVRTQPLPTEDGRVLLVRTGAGSHEAAVIGARDAERQVGVFRCTGLRGVPSPHPGTVGLLIAYDAADHTVLYRVDAGDLRAQPLLRLTGRLAGESWLDEGGDVLAANHVTGDGHRLVLLDLRRAEVTPAPAAGALVLTSPRRGAMLVARDTRVGRRLAWVASDGSVERPAGLDRLTGSVRPLVTDPTGRLLALRVADGARSRLLVHDRETDAVTECPTPDGVIRAAGWGEHGLRVLHTGPTRPATVIPVPGETTAPADRPWHEARLERLAGPAGPIEAVAYGDPGRSAHLVVALHGGPDAHWDLSFTPLFQCLAAAGVAILAVNQRGSTGYGAAHQSAIQDAWGGPDLADIRHLGAALRRRRRAAGLSPPMLYGISYGAFLALLAAAADPHGWSRCAVTAPFVSAEMLYRDAGPPVRRLIDRLGGRAAVEDDLGTRDLLRLAPRLRIPVMVVHGTSDDVIPVRHSRVLIRALPGPTRYREVPGGHNPVDGAGGHALRAEIVAFLTSDRPC